MIVDHTRTTDLLPLRSLRRESGHAIIDQAVTRPSSGRREDQVNPGAAPSLVRGHAISSRSKYDRIITTIHGTGVDGPIIVFASCVGRDAYERVRIAWEHLYNDSNSIGNKAFRASN
jgi:hypothetical protein